MKKARFFENPSDCPVTRTIQFIGGRWKPIILHCLSGGTLRFGQLCAYIPTISRKILTEQLKELEQDGLILRTMYPEIPPRVEYKLTEAGASLQPVLHALCEWGESRGRNLETQLLPLAIPA
jgi:DNA-binding HxlR family transcriptional regulator